LAACLIAPSTARAQADDIPSPAARAAGMAERAGRAAAPGEGAAAPATGAAAPATGGRRSTGMMVSGIVTSVMGGLLVIPGAALMFFPPIGAPLLVSGVVHLSVGIPLAVVGAKPASPAAARPEQAIIQPQPKSWAWRF
jgi:hypothetical protein